MKRFARWGGGILLWLGLSAVAAPTARAAAKGDPRAEKVHVVGAGQTLARIAKRFHVTVEALREANDLAPSQKLHEGMKLVIPGDEPSDTRASKKKAVDPEARGERDRDRERSEAPRARDKKKERDEERGDDGLQKAGHVKIVLDGESWQGAVFEKKSRVSRRAQEGFSRVLSAHADSRHAIHPRLIATMAEVSDHFGGRTIEVVSGFRPRAKGQRGSRSKHNDGAAIDFRIAGVSNAELRDFCKSIKKLGCGYYPNNTFVHVDVRDKATSWVDLARPGEPARYTKIEAGKRADQHGSDDGESKSTRLVSDRKR